MNAQPIRPRSKCAPITSLFARGDSRCSIRQQIRESTRFVPALESLEARHLMTVVATLDWSDLAGQIEGTDTPAADSSALATMTSDAPRHNAFFPEDVDDDGVCAPLDALTIINALNSRQSGSIDGFGDVNDDGVLTPLDSLLVINRLNSREFSEPDLMAARSPTPTPTPQPASGVRSIDGTGNNLAHPDWGSTDEQLLRKAAAEYSDGVASPAGDDRPSAREISNSLAAHGEEDTPNDRDVTAYIYVWGQFLDHDLDLTKSATPTELFSIPVPTGDPEFDPTGTGTQIIPLTRSIFDPATGTSTANPRQQINQITSWIDGSMIYGSDTVRAAALRSLSGGKLSVLSTDVGDLPPLNTANLPIANDAHRVANTQLYLAGDVRSNENIELTSMHTLFIREHNRLATEIAAANPSLTDEQVFQRARSIVIAEVQAITYKEWLPALLGAGALKSYAGYNPNVNPGIANEFSTAAFRLHSTINDDVEFFDNEGRPIAFDYTDDYEQTISVEGEIALFDAFFNATMFKQTGVDGILKYAASTHAEEIDNQLVDSLRNFLFGQPGQGGLDLASLNIQRGRDHGLADYNAVRAAYGLPKVTSFAQITSDTEAQTKLKELYGSVDNIDLWVGGLAEDHVRGSSMGPLFQRIIADQFQRLRDGDRFWYQRVFTGTQLTQIERTTLADIIERNTGVEGLQNNVFVFRAEASGTVFFDANGDGDQDRGEIGLAKVTVELLNDEGKVIETTLTGRDGRYRLTSFPESGDFAVRVVLPTNTVTTTAVEHEFLITAGDVRVTGLNFGLKSAATTPTPTPIPAPFPTPTPTPTPSPTPTGTFDIQFRFVGLSATQQAVFDQAASKWESIIVGDLPAATYNGIAIDDLLIDASATAIDGRGSILAQAGPDRFHAGSQLPYHGSMQFDTADLASMQASGALLGVIEHEMGHILGIGTLWQAKGLIIGAGTSNPQFTGAQAVAQYNSIFGTTATGVPVENTGGSGTRNAHWRDSILGSELMTGFVGPGTNMPISRITVASLADIGYSVNLAAADMFTPPRVASSFAAAPSTTTSSSSLAASKADGEWLDWSLTVDAVLEGGTDDEACLA